MSDIQSTSTASHGVEQPKDKVFVVYYEDMTMLADSQLGGPTPGFTSEKALHGIWKQLEFLMEGESNQEAELIKNAAGSGKPVMLVASYNALKNDFEIISIDLANFSNQSNIARSLGIINQQSGEHQPEIECVFITRNGVEHGLPSSSSTSNMMLPPLNRQFEFGILSSNEEVIGIAESVNISPWNMEADRNHAAFLDQLFGNGTFLELENLPSTSQQNQVKVEVKQEIVEEQTKQVEVKTEPLHENDRCQLQKSPQPKRKRRETEESNAELDRVYPIPPRTPPETRKKKEAEHKANLERIRQAKKRREERKKERTQKNREVSARLGRGATTRSRARTQPVQAVEAENPVSSRSNEQNSRIRADEQGENSTSTLAESEQPTTSGRQTDRKSIGKGTRVSQQAGKNKKEKSIRPNRPRRPIVEQTYEEQCRNFMEQMTARGRLVQQQTEQRERENQQQQQQQLAQNQNTRVAQSFPVPDRERLQLLAGRSMTNPGHYSSNIRNEVEHAMEEEASHIERWLASMEHETQDNETTSQQSLSAEQIQTVFTHAQEQEEHQRADITSVEEGAQQVMEQDLAPSVMENQEKAPDQPTPNENEAPTVATHSREHEKNERETTSEEKGAPHIMEQVSAPLVDEVQGEAQSQQNLIEEQIQAEPANRTEELIEEVEQVQTNDEDSDDIIIVEEIIKQTPIQGLSKAERIMWKTKQFQMNAERRKRLLETENQTPSPAKKQRQQGSS